MWETFKGRHRRAPGEPAVSITKAGNLGLNSAIVRNFVGDARFATLLYDRDKHLIGIKVTKSGDGDSYPIKLSPKDNYALISGVSFLKYYEIYPTESRVYSASFDEKNRIIIVDATELAKKTGGKDKKHVMSA
jgi:hypothetical protein